MSNISRYSSLTLLSLRITIIMGLLIFKNTIPYAMNTYSYNSENQNSWWVRPELILEDEKIREHDIIKYKFIPELLTKFPADIDCILTLRGPRQIGKSTTLKLIIKDLLLNKKINKEAVFFFSCDRVETHNQLYDIAKSYIDHVKAKTSERRYLFIDEISFVSEWPRAIKSLADEGRLKNTTVLLTGSNLIDLKLSSEKMPGRRGKLSQLDYELLPLSFRSFLQTVNPSYIPKSPQEYIVNRNYIDKYFDDYLLIGGFPTAINEYYQQDFVLPYVYKLYSSWIEGDITKTGHSEKIMYHITNLLFNYLSTPVSWNKLGKEAGLIAHTTVSKYAEILEKMFVLLVIENMDISKHSPILRKNKKFYFRDPLIFHTLFSKKQSIEDNIFFNSKRALGQPEFKSKLVESVICEHLFRKHTRLFYWKNKKEIDFISEKQNNLSFYEVKYQKDTKAQDFKEYLNFTGNKPITIITRDAFETQGKISLIPITYFLLT